MPNVHAAKKRVRADRKRHQQNLNITSELKTLTRNLQALIKEKKTDQARQTIQKLTKRLDQAASKGLLHRNTASRKKSRLARLLAPGSTS